VKALLIALLALPPAYVVPAERILTVLQEQRQKQTPLRIEAELSGLRDDWPQEVVFELHPEFGSRVQDDLGGRWLFSKGRLRAGSSDPAPSWVPELEVLVLKDRDALRTWFTRARVDLERNELARCGETDCFVLGGRDGRSQLWLEKNQFDVQRWVTSGGVEIHYRSYADWDGLRFPGVIELHDRNGIFATLAIHSVSVVPHLREGDFSQSWVVTPAD
jgi:hypothetical protein